MKFIIHNDSQEQLTRLFFPPLMSKVQQNSSFVIGHIWSCSMYILDAPSVCATLSDKFFQSPLFFLLSPLTPTHTHRPSIAMGKSSDESMEKFFFLSYTIAFLTVLKMIKSELMPHVRTWQRTNFRYISFARSFRNISLRSTCAKAGCK